MRKTPSYLTKFELQQIPPPSTPFEIFGIDHMRPFPKTVSGNRSNIVVTDYLIKWVEVAAVPDTWGRPPHYLLEQQPRYTT